MLFIFPILKLHLWASEYSSQKLVVPPNLQLFSENPSKKGVNVVSCPNHTRNHFPLLTAVWALMWVQPTILAVLRGLSSPARFLRAIIPGISAHAQTHTYRHKPRPNINTWQTVTTNISLSCANIFLIWFVRRSTNLCYSTSKSQTVSDATILASEQNPVMSQLGISI